jgi:chromosome segregation ATPase
LPAHKKTGPFMAGVVHLPLQDAVDVIFQYRDAAPLGFFAAQHGEASREVDALKATLDEQTGAISDNSAEWAIKKLSDEGVLDAARQLGVDLGTVTDAALGNTDAMAELNAELATLEERQGLRAMGDAGTLSETEAGIRAIREVLGDTNSTLEDAREKWELESAAKSGSAEASKGAKDAQDGVTGAWLEGADAASDLANEADTLGEALSELAGGFLDQRQAQRQVRSSLREVQGALEEYREEHGNLKGAFREGTETGDEFAAMLDGLAQDYLKQIETTERLTGSERKTMQAYREARQSLKEVATQLGMNDKEADKYIKTILGTPKDARTRFDADTAEARAKIEALQRAIEEAARNRRARIDVTVAMHRSGRQTIGGLQEADGGIVQAYAGGGIVDRVPQLRQGGGAIVWNEPETGWEAYISGKPSMAARNRQVWLESGRRLGFLGGHGGGGRGGGQTSLSLAGLTLRADVEGLGEVMFTVAEEVAGDFRAHDRRQAATVYSGVSDG